MAIRSALETAPKLSNVAVLSDSEVVINQLTGEFQVTNLDLLDLRTSVLAVIHGRQLTVTFEWIRRGNNRADTLLKRGANQRSRSNDHG